MKPLHGEKDEIRFDNKRMKNFKLAFPPRNGSMYTYKYSCNRDGPILLCDISIKSIDIKKRWQEYTELYKKALDDPVNHDGVISHLEPDILECEVK